MDIQRTFLLFALFLVSFMLWNAWEKDYLPAPIAKTSEVTNKKQTIAGDVTIANPEITSSANKGQIIHVKTPLLNVDIDTLGGNIVRASLPAYHISLENKQAFVLLNDDPDTLYIAQSGLASKEGPDTPQGSVNFTTSATEYQLEPKQNRLSVDLIWRNHAGITVTKSFIFNQGSYTVNVIYKIDNRSQTPWKGHLFTQLKHKKPIEVKQGLFHFSTYLGAAISSPEKPYEKIAFDKMEKSNTSREIQGGWLAMLQQYFLSAWIPDPIQTYHYYSRASSESIYTIGAISPEITVAPNEQATTSAKVYIGPAVTDYLKTVAPNLDLTIDYGFLWFISTAIFWLMKQIHNIVGNWGWSIVLVTLIIKLCFYKLSAASYKSMAAMRNLQPRIQALKERYGDDRQKLSQATMDLYRKEKVNPLGGCLPVLIQIPVFLALYWVLIESVQLRQAPFILWIHDLSVKDPYYILPLIMGITIFIQQRLNPPPPDPLQAKIMMFLPVVFTVFFLNFPAGLVLYWVANNTLSIIQQWYIMRSLEQGDKYKKARK